jgi:hypothetical protein
MSTHPTISSVHQFDETELTVYQLVDGELVILSLGT